MSSGSAATSGTTRFRWAARRLKGATPDALMIFGGPQVPDRPRAFLRAHPFIDVVVHNEGERTFLELLEPASARDWSGMRGVSYIDRRRQFRPRGAAVERMRDLEEVPSPFLNGMFDQLMRANPRRAVDRPVGDQSRLPIPMHILRLGLRHRRQGRRSSTCERLLGEVDWFADNRIEVHVRVATPISASCRATSTSPPAVAEIEARDRLSGRVVGAEHQERHRARLRDAEDALRCGIQQGRGALDAERRPTTLENIKRAQYLARNLSRAAAAVHPDSVETYTDLILGLPGRDVREVSSPASTS